MQLCGRSVCVGRGVVPPSIRLGFGWQNALWYDDVQVFTHFTTVSFRGPAARKKSATLIGLVHGSLLRRTL